MYNDDKMLEMYTFQQKEKICHKKGQCKIKCNIFATKKKKKEGWNIRMLKGEG